jgi:murein DD-endopeptidase MepM/ murein hydrolase activator NlpD
VSIERIPPPAASGSAGPAESKGTIDKATVARLAAEFESLLLSNIFHDMRSAGRWSDEDSSDTLGAGAFGQTFDTELARTLSKAGGFGLSGWLQQALGRYGSAGDSPSLAGAVATTTNVTAPAAIASNAPIAQSEPSSVPTPATGDPVDPAGVAGSEGLSRPTSKLTSAFGWRRDPVTGAARFHSGVDLKASEGDPVKATGNGRVVFSGANGGYGTNVVIEHANGIRTRYAHLSAALVNVGDEVNEGQPIGLAGHTGRATGPHVHYEVLARGRAVDPLR